METHALIAVYNDYASLGMAIHSVKDYVDRIVIVDGAYKKYYQNYLKSDKDVKPWSTDGSIEIAKSIKGIQDKLTVIPPRNGEPWENQCVKRTALLDAVPQGDWFVILDADEMLYGNPKVAFNHIMSSGCLAGSIPLYNAGLDASTMVPYWHPRIFLKLDGMHYARKHWNLRDDVGRVVENSYPVKWTDEMVIVHLKAFKDQGRLAPHLGYMHMMSLDGWMEPSMKPDRFNLQ